MQALAIEILNFADMLDQIIGLRGDLMTNKLTHYLYEIATKFTGFVTHCQSEPSATSTSMLLVQRIAHIPLHVMEQRCLLDHCSVVF